MKHQKKNKSETAIDTFDHHWYYEQSVQSPDHDIPFFESVYKKKNGRLPRVLREDFCGTALLSASWVKKHPENRAIGVDLDESVLDWGRNQNQGPLGDDAERLTLLCSDVREVHEPRADVIAALKELTIPIVRWPGGCYVSGYHWKDGVGKNRKPTDDMAWGVVEPHTFGTDEFVQLSRLVGCQPYICNNAGNGTVVEMRDWVEYCNGAMGEFAQQRIDNGTY